jgi:branched-chain amino acid transport system substrate-binding protein
MAALAGMAVAPDAHAQDPNVIKIVSSLPQTGSANAQIMTIVNGIKLAIDEVGGKVGNFTIQYEAWDDASPERGQWDSAVETANAQKAVADPDIMVYIGTFNSGAAKFSMPILNKASLLMISPANTWPGLTKPGVGEANEPASYRPTGKVTYYRVVPTDDMQGPVAAKWAKDMGCKRVYLLHDRELYGKGIATMFEKASGPLGLEILGNEGIDPKAANYRSLATKIKQKNPDLVYFGGTTQTNAGQIAKDLRAAGLSVKLMLPDGCFEDAFIQAAGASNVEGNTFITFGGLPADKLTGKGAEYFANYKKKYNSEPQAYSAYGYECGRAALEAIRIAGKKDRAAIAEACGKIKDFDGLLGKWSFDANGDITTKTLSGNTVKNGKFEFVKILGE